jgi:hypothetical protein
MLLRIHPIRIRIRLTHIRHMDLEAHLPHLVRCTKTKNHQGGLLTAQSLAALTL